MKQQFLYISWWVPKENYNSYYDFLHSLEYKPFEEKFLSWNKTFGERLWEDWEYLRAPFRERKYADYTEWKIMFEKVIPFIKQDICIGAGSLWVSFILKYIWENDGIFHPETKQKIHIKKIFFIAPAIADTADEVLWSFAVDLEQVYTKIQRWCKEIYIYHSKDDPVVPFEQWLALNNYFPEAVFREFDDRGHFYKELRFPELEADLKT